MKQRNRKWFDPEFKARVALAAVQERESLAQLGKKFGVHPVLVGQWKKLLLEIVSKGEHRRASHVLRRLHQDLEQLGLRPRRTHDARRTFISLAQADGAQSHILKWVSHGPPKDIVSSYTTLPWDTLCGEVAKLRLHLTAREAPTVQSAAITTVLLRSELGMKKPPSLKDLEALSQRGVRDLNPWPPA